MEFKTAYRNPWQGPFAKRIIGSIRRDCLDRFTSGRLMLQISAKYPRSSTNRNYRLFSRQKRRKVIADAY